MATNLPQLMTLPEVAEALRVPLSTVYQWAAERRLPVVKLGHRTSRVPKSALVAWIEARTVPAVEEMDDGVEAARRGLGGRLQVPGCRDRSAEALPAFDWARDHEAGGRNPGAGVAGGGDDAGD